MKYHIKAIKNVEKRFFKRKIVAHRRASRTICSYALIQSRASSREKIDFDLLFAVGELPSAEPLRSPRRINVLAKAVAVKLKRAFASVKARLLHFCGKLSARRHKGGQRIAFFAGALCASLCVALLSVVIVLAGLFAGYLAPYEEITVPTLVGRRYSDLSGELSDAYELTVSFENSDSIAAGTVISQTPSPNVTRKLYKSGDKCAVYLTVSMGKHYYEVADLSGCDERLAVLELRNAGVAVNTTYEYASDVTAGTIISTSPTKGERLYDGQLLTVTVSLGKRIKTVSVPELYGLGEAQAKAILEARGLRLGATVYKVSDVAAGKITAQDASPYSRLPEGSAVNITVSLGNTVNQKFVPDLYGTTVEEAQRRLAEAGLVLGGIYHVSSAAPTGTVVTQTPIAGTPITSSVISVDIYVSS